MNFKRIFLFVILLLVSIAYATGYKYPTCKLSEIGEKVGNYYCVESGDSLSWIAAEYGGGETYQQLAEMNKIPNPDRIYIGQKIYLSDVPTKIDTSAKTYPINKCENEKLGAVHGNGVYYCVKQGDTLSQIAKDHTSDNDYLKLAKINGIEFPHWVYVEQKIFLKETEESKKELTELKKEGGPPKREPDRKNLYETTDKYILYLIQKEKTPQEIWDNIVQKLPKINRFASYSDFINTNIKEGRLFLEDMADAGYVFLTDKIIVGLKEVPASKQAEKPSKYILGPKRLIDKALTSVAKNEIESSLRKYFDDTKNIIKLSIVDDGYLKEKYSDLANKEARKKKYSMDVYIEGKMDQGPKPVYNLLIVYVFDENKFHFMGTDEGIHNQLSSYINSQEVALKKKAVKDSPDDREKKSELLKLMVNEIIKGNEKLREKNNKKAKAKADTETYPHRGFTPDSRPYPLTGPSPGTYSYNSKDRLNKLLSGEMPYDSLYFKSALCSVGVNLAMDYVFGLGASCDLGILNKNAWDYKKSIVNSGGEAIPLKDVDFDELEPGSIIGFYYDESNFNDDPRVKAGSGYTHLAFYLGNGEIVHKYPTIIRKDNINNLMDGSLHKFRDGDEGGKFRIVEVLVPPQEILLKTRDYSYREFSVGVGDLTHFLETIGIKIPHAPIYIAEIAEINEIKKRGIELNNINLPEKIWIPVVDVCGSKVVGGSEVVGIIGGEIGEGVEGKRNLLERILDYQYTQKGTVENRLTKEGITPKQWADVIIDSMIEADLPLTKSNIAFIARAIEGESNFRTTPNKDINKIFERKIEELEKNGEPVKAYFYKYFYNDNKVEIDSLTNEKEFDDFLDRVYFGLVGLVPDWLFDFKPKTVGSMQLSVDKAVVIAKKRGDSYSKEEMRKILYDLKGGILYGTLYSKEILEIYFDDLTNKYTQDKLQFAFSDYHSGQFSSRNAAFQKQLNKLMSPNYLSSGPLVLDGDIDGPKTKKAIEEFLEKKGENKNLVKSVISNSHTKNLESTWVYNLIKKEYRSKTGKNPEYAIIPEISTDSYQWGTTTTVQDYATEAQKRYNLYCGWLGC